MIAAVPPTTLVAGGRARTHAGGAPMTRSLLIREYEVGADRHSAGVGPASTLARPRPRLR